MSTPKPVHIVSVKNKTYERHVYCACMPKEPQELTMSHKNRLDIELAREGLVTSRSQAESYIRLGKVTVNGKVVRKPGFFVTQGAVLVIAPVAQYVSRAGLKLASVSHILHIDFHDKTVLDVGSSTGGFTDFALQHGAKKVYAVDVGTDQMHQRLRGDDRIELHEQTDIRAFSPTEAPDIVVIDVSFVSLREILPHIATLCNKDTQVVAMFKPQFEAGSDTKHKGVIKNDAMRRDILKQFEVWVKQRFVIVDKADSEVAGSKGNREKFYVLRIIDKAVSKL